MAITVANLLRPHVKDAPNIPIERFMLKDPRAMKRANLAKIAAVMEASAKATERRKKAAPSRRK